MGNKDIFDDEDIKQIQDEYPVYKFPLEVKIEFKDSTSENKIFKINERDENFSLKLNKKPINLVFDPDSWLLANFRYTGYKD